MQATDVQNPGRGGGGLLYAKIEKFSSSRVQIKDSGLTCGVDEEASPLLHVAVKVSLKRNVLIY